MNLASKLITFTPIKSCFHRKLGGSLSIDNRQRSFRVSLVLKTQPIFAMARKSFQFSPPLRNKSPALSPSVLAASPSLLLFSIISLGFPLPAAAFSLQDAVTALEGAVAAAGPAGPLLFIAAYVAATVLLIPASLLTVGAGFIFGPILGTAVVSAASTLGATASFLVGRYLARPAVSRKASADPRFAAVDAAIAAEGAKIVLLLRLSPLVPFGLLNYVLSLTSIPLGQYVAASWAGMLPGTVAYVALGGAGKAAAESAAGGGTTPLQVALYGVGVAATLGATALISRAASKALKEAQLAAEEGEGGGEGGGEGQGLVSSTSDKDSDKSN